MGYSVSASVYDAIYTQMKDYQKEAQRLKQLVQSTRGGMTKDMSLLDVACGTGLHLKHLDFRFDHVEGLDLSAEMLMVARKRLPDVQFHQASMTNFDLGRKFDVVTCLFSAIGHLLDREDLEAALIHMSRHLNPFGVLVIEPWLKPETFDPSRVLSAELVDRPDLKVARFTRTTLEGIITKLEMSYMVATEEGVSTFDEVLVAAMWSEEDFLRAGSRAGIELSFDPEGLSDNGRGVYIGNKLIH